MAKNPFSTLPLNSRLTASSMSCPARASYSKNTWRNCWYERLTKTMLKTDSSVPHCPSPASNNAWASWNKYYMISYRVVIVFLHLSVLTAWAAAWSTPLFSSRAPCTKDTHNLLKYPEVSPLRSLSKLFPYNCS